MTARMLLCVVCPLLLMVSSAAGQESPEVVQLKEWIMDYLTGLESIQCEYTYSTKVYGHGSSVEHYSLKARGDDYRIENTIEQNVSMGNCPPGSKIVANHLAGTRKQLNEIVGIRMTAEINGSRPTIPEHLLGPRLLMGRGGRDTSLLEILGAPGYAKVFQLGSTTVFSYRRDFEKRMRFTCVDVYISDERINQIDWCFRPRCPMEEDLQETESDLELRTLIRTVWLSSFVTVNGVSFPCDFRGMVYNTQWGSNFAQMVALDEQGKINKCDYEEAIMSEATSVPTSEEAVAIDAASLKINEEIPDSALDITIPKNITIVDRTNDTLIVPPKTLWAMYSDLILLAVGLGTVAVLLTSVWAWRRWR